MDVALSITIDSRGATTGAGRVNNALDGVERRAKSATTAVDLLKRAFLAYITVDTIRRTIQAADSMSLLSARVDIVTESLEESLEVQQDLFEIAQESRTSFEGVVDLYSRFAVAAKSLGLEQEKVLSVTETINKAVTISGATALEAEGALRQLSQGLAANALRGQELNSVMEQTPRLAIAIAEGLGITIGELREVAAQGQITGEAVIEALTAQADVIEEEFQKMPVTIGQAIQRAQNELLVIIGSLDKTSESTSILVGLIGDLTDEMIDLADFVNDLAKAYKTTLTQQDELTEGSKRFITAALVSISIIDLLATSLITVLGGAFDALGKMIAGIANALEALAEQDFKSAAEIIEIVMDDISDNISEGSQNLNNELTSIVENTLDRINKLWNSSLRETKENTESTVLEVSDGIKVISDELRRSLGIGVDDEFQENIQDITIALAEEAVALQLSNRELLERELAMNNASDAEKDLILKMHDTNEALRKQKELADDIGSAFGSAFEDAIFDAESFRDVINSLSEDIARLIIRQQITQPFAEAVSAGVGQLFGGGTASAANADSFGESPSFQGGGFTGFGSRSGGVDGRGGFMAVLHPNETVVDHERSQSVVSQPVTISQTIDARGATPGMEDKIRQAAEEGARRGYALVANDFKTGQGIRKTIPV